MTEPLVRLEIDQRGDATVVSLRGELDVSNVGVLRGKIVDAIGDRPLLVDLGAVDYLDSSAIAVLFDVAEHARGAALHMTIVAPPGSAAAHLLAISPIPSVDIVPEAT